MNASTQISELGQWLPHRLLASCLFITLLLNYENINTYILQETNSETIKETKNNDSLGKQKQEKDYAMVTMKRFGASPFIEEAFFPASNCSILASSKLFSLWALLSSSIAKSRCLFRYKISK